MLPTVEIATALPILHSTRPTPTSLRARLPRLQSTRSACQSPSPSLSPSLSIDKSIRCVRFLPLDSINNRQSAPSQFICTFPDRITKYLPLPYLCLKMVFRGNRHAKWINHAAYWEAKNKPCTYERGILHNRRNSISKKKEEVNDWLIWHLESYPAAQQSECPKQKQQFCHRVKISSNSFNSFEGILPTPPPSPQTEASQSASIQTEEVRRKTYHFLL